MIIPRLLKRPSSVIPGCNTIEFFGHLQLEDREDVLETCGNHPSQSLYHKTRTYHNVERSSFQAGKRYLLRDFSVAASALSLIFRGCFVVKTLHEAKGPGAQKQAEPCSGDHLFFRR